MTELAAWEKRYPELARSFRELRAEVRRLDDALKAYTVEIEKKKRVTRRTLTSENK